MKRFFDAAPPKAPSPPPKADSTDRKLVVGHGIVVSGEIKSCDCLLVEGRVEADVSCRELKVVRGGLFMGTATVDNAEIIGRFEGQLNVRERLVIRASGSLAATVRYKQIEIERGGQLAGTVEAAGTADAARPLPREQRRSASVG
ncbi:MAG TPA: polymer-forming cytoskeletal protein [Stellaceae bacterium]|nr:polymer-forming cytoskeletal protein [Stellaceae bacterium]